MSERHIINASTHFIQVHYCVHYSSLLFLSCLSVHCAHQFRLLPFDYAIMTFIIQISLVFNQLMFLLLLMDGLFCILAEPQPL
jgi:hypothetical protein